MQGGSVTEKGMAELRSRMPFADLGRFKENPDVSALGQLFTVDTITRYIEEKLSRPYGN